MSISVKATIRSVQGTSASRRLRRDGKVPGIIYGANQTPVMIELDHNELYHSLRKEAFHSSILKIELEGKTESVVVRNTQWHAFKPKVLHIDFLRVSATEKLMMEVPLHFINEETCPAIKLQSAIVSHVINSIEISCLPADLPEFIQVDLAELSLESSVHIGQIVLPKGVELAHHLDTETVIATAVVPSAEVEAPIAEETPKDDQASAASE